MLIADEIIVKNCLEITDLNLYYGPKQALRNIHIDIPENKITALIGPSGCGKSTLLRACNRMHDLESNVHISGRILFQGKNIYDSSMQVYDLRKSIGMVFQKPNPFPKSIFENVAFGLMISGVPKKQHADLVEKALIQSFLFDEVKDKLRSPALSLSGGQQQRLCIARAIAVEPKLLLMDEPCSALDPISTAKIETLLLGLREHYTIVIVTHNMEQAHRISDFTGFLYMGELVEWRPTVDMFKNPYHDMTKSYVQGHIG